MNSLNIPKKLLSTLPLLSALAITGCIDDSSSSSTSTDTTDAEAKTLDIQTVLAVFAHPDDEISAAPLLAKFAREGKTVHLAVVTDGRWGGASNDEEATALAATRALETQCSTSALGLEDPILLEFEDGEVSEDLYTIKATLAGLYASIEPDLVMTWGPEGGYGHKDHRLVSAITTDIFQDGSEDGSAWPEALYYPALPETQVQGFTPTSQFGGLIQAVWGTTEEEYLQYTITVTDEDVAAAKEAMACHASQFDAANQVDIGALIDASNNTIYLRKALTTGDAKTALD